MKNLSDFLKLDHPILLDGAIGTMLINKGLDKGGAPEEWNVLYPERVKEVHQAYIQAGSNIILTNSFGGNRARLAAKHFESDVTKLNYAAAFIAREAADAADDTVFVGGSMGPTGSIQPLGGINAAEAREIYAEQAEALVDGGVDLLWIETMSSLEEVIAAVEGAQSVCDIPVAASMSFDTHGHTMMGVSPAQAFETFREYNLTAFGANCGNGPAEIEEVLEKMWAIDHQAVLIAKSNAGLPKMVDGEIFYDGTPEVMAEHALKVRELGARLIGGCCGSTPDHIRAMSQALQKN